MLVGGPRFQAGSTSHSSQLYAGKSRRHVLFVLTLREVDSDFLQGAAFGVGTEKSFYYDGNIHQYSGKEYPPTSGHVFLKSPWVGNDPDGHQPRPKGLLILCTVLG